MREALHARSAVPAESFRSIQDSSRMRPYSRRRSLFDADGNEGEGEAEDAGGDGKEGGGNDGDAGASGGGGGSDEGWEGEGEPTDTGAADTGDADTGDADTGDGDAHVRAGEDFRSFGKGEDVCDRLYRAARELEARRKARRVKANAEEAASARRVEANAEEAASVISPQLTTVRIKRVKWLTLGSQQAFNQMALQLKRRDSLALKAAKRDSLPGGTGLEAEVATNGARLPAPVSAGERLYAQGERRR
ncbi:hypothetical protein T492DRAFT_841286 [Pavlovales sp. CCMP2436]|nr:hypothetical protein T492DRAFT_841286 [Pavlovales sp. CCMP2436]